MEISLLDGFRDHAVHRADVINRQLFVNGPDSISNCPNKRGGIAQSSRDEDRVATRARNLKIGMYEAGAASFSSEETRTSPTTPTTVSHSTPQPPQRSSGRLWL